jgi:hypothetical protein
MPPTSRLTSTALGRERLPARKGEQPLGQRRGPGCAVHRVVDHLGDARRIVGAPLGHVEAADHDRQHVVEIVRDAAGQLPHRLHLLHLADLFLGSLAALHLVPQAGIGGDDLRGAFLDPRFQGLVQATEIRAGAFGGKSGARLRPRRQGQKKGRQRSQPSGPQGLAPLPAFAETRPCGGGDHPRPAVNRKHVLPVEARRRPLQRTCGEQVVLRPDGALEDGDLDAAQVVGREDAGEQVRCAERAVDEALQRPVAARNRYRYSAAAVHGEVDQ